MDFDAERLVVPGKHGVWRAGVVEAGAYFKEATADRVHAETKRVCAEDSQERRYLRDGVGVVESKESGPVLWREPGDLSEDGGVCGAQGDAEEGTLGYDEGSERDGRGSSHTDSFAWHRCLLEDRRRWGMLGLRHDGWTVGCLGK